MEAPLCHPCNCLTALQKSVDGVEHFGGRKRRDHPLDLTPVTETDDVAVIAALFGADGRFESSLIAEGVDQAVRIVECAATGDEKR